MPNPWELNWDSQPSQPTSASSAASLPPWAQNWNDEKLAATPPVSTSPAQSPSFLGELYDQTIGGAIDAAKSGLSFVGHHVAHPLDAALDDYSSLARGPVGPIRAAHEEGKAAWDALTGRGEFASMTPLERASSATGHGLAAALPVLGPMASHAAENLGSENFGAGAADLVSLGAMLFGPKLLGKGVDALPSKARAIEGFRDVEAAAGHVPINISPELSEVVLRTKDLASRGQSMPRVINQFLARVSDPRLPDLSYSEARDFVSAASSRLSAEEAQRLTPSMRNQLARFTAELNKSITDAAASVGKGDAYTAAREGYAQAARWQDRAQTLRDTAVSGLKKTAPFGVPLGLYEIYRKLFK